MELGVLGPLQLTCNGANLVPTAPKPRQLLAFLMLNVNQMVRDTDCITELWGAQPPRTAMSTLQTYVLQIRQILRATADARGRDILWTRHRGYQLRVDPQRIDRVRFAELVGSGRRAAAAGDHRRSSSLFGAALALWRGPALSDVRTGPLSSPHVVQLEENRMGVLEERIEADLALGRHEEILGELAELVSAHPTNENITAQYMLALYRSGAADTAVAVFQRLCDRLVDELGIEPARRLSGLLGAILTGDPLLDLDGAPGAGCRTRCPAGR